MSSPVLFETASSAGASPNVEDRRESDARDFWWDDAVAIENHESFRALQRRHESLMDQQRNVDDILRTADEDASVKANRISELEGLVRQLNSRLEEEKGTRLDVEHRFSKVADELDMTRSHARSTQRMLDRLEKQMEVSRTRSNSLRAEHSELMGADADGERSACHGDGSRTVDHEAVHANDPGLRESTRTPTPTEDPDALARQQTLDEELRRARESQAQIQSLQRELQSLRDALEERDIELQLQQSRRRSGSTISSGSDRLSPERLCTFDSCVACGQMFAAGDESVCEAANEPGNTHQSARELAESSPALRRSKAEVRAARVVPSPASGTAAKNRERVVMPPLVGLSPPPSEDEFASAEEGSDAEGPEEVMVRQGLEDIHLFFDCEEPPDPLETALAAISAEVVGAFVAEHGRVSKSELEERFVHTLAHHGRVGERRAQAALRKALSQLESVDDILIALDDVELQLFFCWRRM